MSKFLWGVATSAFQIEGHIKNDMTQWEAEGRFKTDGKNPIYGNGANHWQLWEQDFELLKELNVNAYRFSVEWSRIEPQPGVFNEEAIRRYEKMIDRLLEMNITPMLTIHHFTHPVWFHNASPWTSKDAIRVYFRFAEKIIRRFAVKVPYWISFNEPLVWTIGAYGAGKFPPGGKDAHLVMQALHNMLEAHIKVYRLLKSCNPDAQMGIAKNFIIFKEHRNWFLPDKGIANRLDMLFNQSLPQAFLSNRLRFRFWPWLNYDKEVALNNHIDFWGINYYYRLHTRFQFNLKQPVKLIHKNPQTDMGWEIYPEGLKKIIRWLEHTNKNIFITENGIATNDDGLRETFLKSHISVLKQALKTNDKIKGYFYWSFLDNYEWLEGLSKRFGLVHVDYDHHYKRTLKKSAKLFADLRIFE